jgi:small subunit ribosomal protein S8
MEVKLMTISDPIADMLTRLRNANNAYHESVSMPVSKMKIEIAKILNQEGYIRGFDIDNSSAHSELKVTLKYGAEKARAITGLKRISKPGLRVYAKVDDIPRVLGGLGIAILSTSQGMVTDKLAREKQIGGEVLCFVW